LSEPWTVATVLKWAADDFRTRGIENPRLDAEVLLAFALGVARTQLFIDLGKPLDPKELTAFRELVKRRRSREPVAYLRGFREFYGRDFKVDARVLIPRPDTECLVDVALKQTAHVSLSMRALDVCTGSGCVGITLARERPTSAVMATDTSDEALAVARDNALRLGAYNVAFARADLFHGLTGPFDVITANPPYIASAEVETLSPDIVKHEPRLALDGGADGLDFVRRIVTDAPALLVSGGTLAMEIGAGQAAAVTEIFEGRGFSLVNRANDYARIPRVVFGTWRP